MTGNDESDAGLPPHTRQETDLEAATEQTPLLPHTPSDSVDQSQPHHETSAEESLQSLGVGKSGRRRWPSVLALLALCVAVILIMVFVFVAPPAVREYAEEALVFEPISLSIDSITSSGVRARIQGDLVMDGSRVTKTSVRDFGRFATWIAGQAETEATDVEVSLPEYGNVVLGRAHVPKVKVNLRDGVSTYIDILTDLEPGNVDGIRQIAGDWIDGRLGQLRVVGKASVVLKSGIFNLGRQNLQQEMVFAGGDLPALPKYEIKKLMFREADQGMAADVSLLVYNDYPVDFAIPALAFRLLVENCEKSEPYIKLADALTRPVHIVPRSEVEVNVTGLVHELPEMLTDYCPGTDRSPLDVLLGNYIHGKESVVFVQGAASPPDTPAWIGDLMSDLTVHIPLPGRSLGHLIRNFTLTDTHFGLPDPWAQPDTPEAMPRISAKVRALVALPEEMNFSVGVSRVRANADVYFRSKKFGRLDLNKWQQANSTRFDASEKEGPSLMVESLMENAPLWITDEDVFTDVIQSLLFGQGSVLLHLEAEVDVEVQTTLGEVVVRKIPAQGEVPIKPISRGIPDHGRNGSQPLPELLKPELGDLRILKTTPTGLTVSALVNITNPTEYSASVPYADIRFEKNGSTLGHATIRDLHITPGRNEQLLVQATYDPHAFSGSHGAAIGRELASQYISGYNTSIVVRMHNESFPSLPSLGRILSHFAIDVPAPKLKGSYPSPPPIDGGDGGDDDSSPIDDDSGPHFIQAATMHLLSSTASFILASPLAHTILEITGLNATALYTDSYGDQSEVGHIDYHQPFQVPPVDAQGRGFESPRLPVQWRLGSVGFEAMRNAVGGRLRVSAFAIVDFRIGKWRERVWFRGGSIGAKVRL